MMCLALQLTIKAILVLKRTCQFTEPPTYEEQASSTEMLETKGIMVIDLIMLLSQRRKSSLFGGAGVGKTVTLMELIRNIAAEHSGIQFSLVLVREHGGK